MISLASIRTAVDRRQRPGTPQRREASPRARGDQAVARYIRSPAFVLSLIVGGVLIVLGLFISVVLNDTVGGVIRDVVDHTRTWPDLVRVSPAALAFVAHLAVAIFLNAWLLLTRRFRRFLLMNAAVVVSTILVNVLIGVLHSLADGLGFERDGAAIFTTTVANVVAAATVLRPWISARLFRWLVLTAAVVAFGPVLSAGAFVPWLGVPHIPMSVAQAQLSGVVALVGVGITSGSLVALLFKTPNPVAAPVELAAALSRQGLEAVDLEPARVDARGSRPFRCTLADGKRLFIKTWSVDERAADLLYRSWRALTLKRSGDREPFTSLRRAVEHETLLALAARARGARTPALQAVGELGDGNFFVAYEEIAGRPLADLNADEISDELLADLWQQLIVLRGAGIAHRDLRLANVMVDLDGEVWLVDFGFAELAAEDELLARDVAQLLAATAASVGVERSARAAVNTVGRELVAGGIAWLQPLTLSAATRHSIGRDRDIRSMREALRESIGLEDVVIPEIKRVTLRQFLGFTTLVVTVVLLAGQVSDFGTLWENLARVDLPLAGLVVGASAATYLGAAVGMRGSVAQPLRFVPTLAAQVASSFANRLTPARLGGMATNARFLVRRGLPGPAAVSAIGLNTVAGLVIHVLMLVVTASLAGRAPSELGVPTPSAGSVRIVALVLVLGSLATFLLPAGRKLVKTHLLPAIRTAVDALVAVARRPGRLTQLFGGSFIVTGAYVVAMVAALRAVGSDLAVPVAAFAYLAGSAVATAAPTPGGLGVVEAALVAIYTAVGVPAEVAVPAVLLFRFATYWLPILPGWVAFNYLTRTRQL